MIDDDELKPEYDISKFFERGVKGKHAEKYKEGTNVVLLDPDVYEVFRTSEAVNETLRLVLRMMAIPGKSKPER